MIAVENADRNSYVLMQVGECRFAMPANILAELAPPVRLHTFPHTAPIVAGVIVRRGQIVPVYDVAPLLLGRSSTAHRFYLIARRGFGKSSEPGAIPVDGECELATGEIAAAEAGRPEYISGKLVVGEESVDVLNFDVLVASHLANESESDRLEAQP